MSYPSRSEDNWINLTQNDFDSLLPVATKETKATSEESSRRERSSSCYSLGVVTKRDEWVYDDATRCLDEGSVLIEAYNAESERAWRI